MSDTIISEQVKLTDKNGQDSPNFQMAKDAKGASLQRYPTEQGKGDGQLERNGFGEGTETWIVGRDLIRFQATVKAKGKLL